jgi:hypothetical protein
MISLRITAAVLVPLAASVAAGTNTAAILQQKAAISQQPVCRLPESLARPRELPEASGVAASRRSEGIFWAHNDSAEPVIFALNEQGVVTRRVRVTGAAVDDWEDIAVGPCPQGSCLYIGDMGDNNGRRDHITLYRTPEPMGQDAATQPVEIFQATYPDGAHDAEGLFVTPASEVFIITKGDPGPIALYRFPRLEPGKRLQLQRIGEPAMSAKTVDAKARPTGADISPDGRWVAVRTTHTLVFYRTADLIAGRWREAFRADLSSLREPRGEGVTFAANGTLVLVGEGGGLSSPGTFARITCTLSE